MANCLNCGKEVKNKYCNVSCQNEHKGKINREKYYEHPKLCSNCNEIIAFEHSRNVFCSHSCAAIKNNKAKIKKEVKKEIKSLIKDNNKGKIFQLSKN